MNTWLKGHYDPKFPEKYVGDISKITYRSSWERVFCAWCDNTPEVLRWSSETIQIPYFDPVQNKPRNYVMDFRIVTRQADGSVKVTLVEIKPHKQTQRPRANRNKSEKTLMTEQATFATNSAKWMAAKKYCQERGWNFVIFTEKDLFGGIDRGFSPAKSCGRRAA